ncbi:MAG: methyltransferase domain-containing protein [Saprospiraceae bacterium]
MSMEMTIALITGAFVIIAAIITGIFSLIASKSSDKSKKKKAVFKGKDDNKIDNNSKYAICSISEIIKNELRHNELNIDSLKFKTDFSILDLKHYTKAIYYPNYQKEKIDNIIDSAREKAYTLKYSKPKEDEKITSLEKIKLSNIKPWEEYLFDFLNKKNIASILGYKILDIGIGNGYAVENLYKNCSSVCGIDISEEAISFAKKKLPAITYFKNQAEHLKDISNSSIDLVFAFRVFQSSLFDKRAAMSEAFRVLSSGGYMIISIPIMLEFNL